MSFNINGPSNIPSIQEAQSLLNNGGGGNLGYFMRQDADEEIKFVNNQGEDSFEKSDDNENFEPAGNASLIERIKKIFKKIRIAIARFIIKRRNKN